MGSDAPVGSIVIPAHNEALVLAECLAALEPGVAEGRFEVVVVSNGSDDGTVDAARTALSGAPHAHVVDLDEPSKMAALRSGDLAASAYPRLYLDADIVVDDQAVSDLFSRLAAIDEPRVGAPRLRMETDGCSWVVRAYHRVWKQLPYVTTGVIGTGAYAVNRRGGERIGEFPDLLNDDEWVRRRFGEHEKIISGGTFVARAPRRVRALIAQRARTEVGNGDLGAVGPVPRDTSPRDLVTVMRSSPSSVLDVAVYVVVTLSARALAERRRRTGRSSTWSTDTSSRLARTNPGTGRS